MIVTKQSLSRRTVLRGLGVSLALPFLDSMVPAFAQGAVTPVRRLGAIYVPMGMNMAKWTALGEGPGESPLTLTAIQQPLTPFKDRVVIVSGLDSKESEANDGGVHPRIQTAWATGVTARATEGVDIRAGVSWDQLAAARLGGETQLASLELAIESPDLGGSCGVGYSCAYHSTIAWRDAVTPLPMENNPRFVFERLFGASDKTDRASRLDLIQRDRSILDGVNDKLARLRAKVGTSDAGKLEQYTDAVREAERRIQIAEEQVNRELLPVVDRPAGVPQTFEAHSKLMYDLMVLAYQTDMTRVASYLVARESSVRSYPEIGVPDAHHPLSHHQDDPEQLEKQAKLNAYHLSMFAHLLEKLQATPDGDGTLLDHTLLVYGSGMSNSNEHMFLNVPTVVVGSRAVGVRGGRHVQCAEGTPLANLQVNVLDRVGVPVDSFGDSDGNLESVAL